MREEWIVSPIPSPSPGETVIFMDDPNTKLVMIVIIAGVLLLALAFAARRKG